MFHERGHRKSNDLHTCTRLSADLIDPRLGEASISKSLSFCKFEPLVDLPYPSDLSSHSQLVIRFADGQNHCKKFVVAVHNQLETNWDNCISHNISQMIDRIFTEWCGPPLENNSTVSSPKQTHTLKTLIETSQVQQWRVGCGFEWAGWRSIERRAYLSIGLLFSLSRSIIDWIPV